MRTAVFLSAALVLCALGAGCGPPKPEETAVEAPGTSLETAVVIQSKGEKDGYKDELDWLVKHYPDYDIKKQGLIRDSKKQKVYDRVEIAVDGGRRAVTIYFDVTKCFGKNERGEDVHFY